MKAKDLISELETFPDDWTVVIRVGHMKADIAALDMEGRGGEVCIVIHDKETK